MKKLLYTLIIILCISSCKENQYFLFNSENRVQFLGSDDLICSFFYEPEEVLESTVYVDIQAIGLKKESRQEISLEQVTEYYAEYTYDVNGVITDSIVHERKNKGVAGTHYVSLDTPSVKEMLFVPAGSFIAKVPIVLKRDKSLKNGDVRICFKIKANDDFLLGEKSFVKKTIILTLELPQPTNWAEYVFGDYSKAKHLFMIGVAKEKIDEVWMDNISNKGTGIDKYWRNKFKDELDKFNKNQENINSGKAPLRVDENDSTSDLIEFK